MENKNCVHLHVHTEYSLLDGISKVKELVNRAKELGMTAIAVTDHGSCAGHKDLEIECEKAGIKPIYGCEFYAHEGDEVCKEDNGRHLMVFAKSEEGLQNLYQLYNESYSTFYRKPHININLLKKYNKGLMVSSACIGGTISQKLLSGEYAIAKEWLTKFKDIFGDDFYLEVQPNDIPDQYIVNKEIFRLARDTKTKVIATNDVHYTFKEDADVHEVLLALQVKQKWDSPKRFKFPTNDYWLKTYDEMVNTFIGSMSDKKEFIQALENTNEVADKCDWVKLPKGDFMPHYNKLKPNQTERDALEEEVKEGVVKKYGVSTPTSLAEQIEHELDVIDEERYSGYFLIVQDAIREARKAGVLVGDGRGSGAGSKVCYLTDITRVDPVKYGLVFERFMDKGRQPDIDVDISDQDWLFKYLQSQYGDLNVARIITYGTLTAKSCTRKILGCFGYSMEEIAKVIGYMPDRLSFSFKEALDESKDLSIFMDSKPFIKRCIERLEGVISHEGKHAGGFVIYPNLRKYLPLKMVTDDNGNRNVPVAMLTKYPLEDAGFVKFDFLGLETLPIIKHTLDLIEEDTGEKVDLSKIDLEDKKIYEMLQKGDVSGIFQLNSQASRLVEQKPRKFSDLIAFTSIIRPGTGDYHEYIERRNGKEWYIAPERQRYMNESEGLMIYQEQYLHDAHTYAGWAYGFSDTNIRKNKKLKEDIELANKFVVDGIARGFNRSLLEKIWEEIVDVASGGYGFNKSHATCYTVITYQTAYLKAYYPNYFYSALLTAKIDNQEEVANIIAECKRKDIKLLPPDLNKGTHEFTPTKEGIRMPLNYLKGVGESVIPEIIRLRPIISLSDLFERRTKAIIRKNVLVSLIKAGCFDFEETRNEMMYRLDMLNRTKTQIKNGHICDYYDYNEKLFMKWEKESLGMYLRKHPLDNHNPKSFYDYKESEMVSVVGEITDVTERSQKNGKMMAFITLDLPCGVVRALSFANIWESQSIKNESKEGNIVYVKGKKSGDSILLDNIESLEVN
ncbi:DNA polymerase III subunit alpha [Romboutsia sp.]|uniref:DNA polymerase III subunit alpha n=1 Tax=Romboutsia sp. TaxID=1965302 RepID=UPI002C3C5FA2|nr:DNA polymerase III subunit alpha [Romboutsia sp.]HSQ90175.1 DNA polymerase III subunit alpha [Romboutsia sp.]